jgi:hypothetical protein
VSIGVTAATLTFEVAGLVDFTQHDDHDFPGSSCAAGPAAGALPTIVCSLGAGTGTFAIDVVVDQTLAVTARIDAVDNVDPNPADNVVVFSG